MRQLAQVSTDVMQSEEASGCICVLEKTISKFKIGPDLKTAHPTALKKYDVFNRRRTADLFITFLALVGDEDLSWLSNAVHVPLFVACVPFNGKNNERPVCGGMDKNSKAAHGIVRYVYKSNIIEEFRKEGQPHGLRVVCTEMGHVWIRLHDTGKRLAQVVLNGDLTEQSSTDEGGLKILQDNLRLIRDCFVDTAS